MKGKNFLQNAGVARTNLNEAHSYVAWGMEGIKELCSHNSRVYIDNITQITACLEQLDIYVDQLAQKPNQDEYVLGNFCEGLVSLSVSDCSLSEGEQVNKSAGSVPNYRFILDP